MFMKKIAVLLALVCFIGIYAFPKDTFHDNRGGAGHADDISRLLTGRSYWSHSGNHALFPVLTGLTHIMHLTVDSRHRDTPSQPTDDTIKAKRFLDQHQRTLGFHRIPDFSDFLTPHGGKMHGEYTHLGWTHEYLFADTQHRWMIRQNILRDALARQFNFFPLMMGQNRQRLDSLAALLYYVHILGDHENNKLATARSRIPIRSLNEQDRYFQDNYVPVRWEQNKNGIPSTNIVAELNRHLSILFANQRGTPQYENLMRAINGSLPSEQQEKARWLLESLFANVPQLLRNESFARNFTSIIR